MCHFISLQLPEQHAFMQFISSFIFIQINSINYSLLQLLSVPLYRTKKQTNHITMYVELVARKAGETEVKIYLNTIKATDLSEAETDLSEVAPAVESNHSNGIYRLAVSVVNNTCKSVPEMYNRLRMNLYQLLECPVPEDEINFYRDVIRTCEDLELWN